LFYAIVTEFYSKPAIGFSIDGTPFGKACYFAETKDYSEQKLIAVAEYAGLTSNYLCALFKAKTGVSYNKYIKRKRLRKAEALLLDGLQAKEVAESCDYQSFSHFMSDFKEVFLMTPNAYKKLHE
jgi:two-component system response regulator YesN